MTHDDSNIQDAIEKSKNIWSWIADELNGLKMPDLPYNRRMQMAAACQHLAIEHAQAIIVVITRKS